MLHKKILETRGFRQLSDEELMVVSGGETQGTPIIVEGGTGDPDLDRYLTFSLNFGALVAPSMFAQAVTQVDFSNIDWSEIDLEDIEDNSDDFSDLDGDGLDDTTGEPLSIVVTGERGSLDGFVLGPINSATGFSHYMYPVGPDGTVVPGTPPVFTPEGEEYSCETFAQAQEQIADAEAQIGFLNNIIGFNPLAWLTYGVLTPQSQASPPEHCALQPQ